MNKQMKSSINKYTEQKRRAKKNGSVRNKEMEELEPYGLTKTPWIGTKNEISKKF
uniref:Uncharacterized protein n=1 Tax=Nelumbo nucifera TaxID=4432 RepID=A0A822YEV4_NELNU|nr:TPA_asm: hypothetical protein HUJ06_030953 [Nelumbo nucifera]